MRPNLDTNVNNHAPAPYQMLPGTIGDAGNTRGANVDNMWPNPTSEANPPPTVIVANDGSSAEWDYRLNAGVGAFAGNWVRQIVASGGSPTRLSVTVPCNTTDRFFFSAWVKAISGANGGFIEVKFLDATGAVLSTTTTVAVTSATWTLATLSNLPNAVQNTVVSVMFSLVAINGGNTVQFDNMLLRRSVEAIHVGAGSNGQLLATSGGVGVWQGDAAWTAVTGGVGFGANFADAPGAQAVQFKKDGTGRFYVRGSVKTSAAQLANAAIFTLPAAYRPAVACSFVATRSPGNPVQINISSAGVVSTPQALLANDVISFDGISSTTD
jgi:hypothetical protein